MGEASNAKQAACLSPQVKSNTRKEYIPVTAGGNLADCFYSSAEKEKLLLTKLTANSKRISLSSNASAGGISFM